VVYAQMGRGKSERILAQAMSSIAATLGKFAMDVCLFISQNFSFISFPDELTTGSSIMPHKKNPDVFELIRSRCNQIQALPNQITMMTTNLPSGYHRDLQLLKEAMFPAIISLKESLEICHFMLQQIEVKSSILEDRKYDYLFSVDAVNALVLQGVPFREAYKQVGAQIENGSFVTDKTAQHQHEGSIGNLCNNEIKLGFENILQNFEFNKVKTALDALVQL